MQGALDVAVAGVEDQAVVGHRRAVRVGGCVDLENVARAALAGDFQEGVLRGLADAPGAVGRAVEARLGQEGCEIGQGIGVARQLAGQGRRLAIGLGRVGFDAAEGGGLHPRRGGLQDESDAAVTVDLVEAGFGLGLRILHLADQAGVRDLAGDAGGLGDCGRLRHACGPRGCQGGLFLLGGRDGGDRSQGQGQGRGGQADCDAFHRGVPSGNVCSHGS